VDGRGPWAGGWWLSSEGCYTHTHTHTSVRKHTAARLWADLAEANDAVEHALRALDAAHHADPAAYAAMLAAFARGSGEGPSDPPALPDRVRTSFLVSGSAV
jgi:hypothetical protein